MRLQKSALVVSLAPCIILLWMLCVLTLAAAATESNEKNNVYSPLPAGQPYKLSAESRISKTGLDEIATRMATLVKSQPPYEIINNYISTGSVTQAQILEYETPLLALAVISLAFAVIIPLVGLFFCCCRLAGKCGGDLDDRKIDIRPTKKRKRYTLAIVVSSIVLLAGSGIIFASTLHMESSLPKTRTTISNVFDDIVIYKNNTFKEFNHILGVEGLQALGNLIEEVIGLARDIAVPVINKGEPLVNELVNSITKIGSAMETSLILIDQVENTVSSLVTNGNQLKSDLGASRQNLTAAKQECVAQAPPGSTVCDVIPGGDELEVVADFNKVQNLTDTATKVQDVVKVNLTHEAAKGNATFYDTPTKIQNLTTNLTAEFKNFSSKVDQIQLDLLRPLEDNVDEFLRANVLPYKMDVDKYLEPGAVVPKYDGYRNTLFIVTGVLVIIGVLAALVGIILGMCGSSTFDTPSTRGDMSDVGGRILMGSAGIFWFSILFVNALAGLAFLAGANTAVICSSVQDYQLLTKTIDDPQVMDGYLLSKLLYGDQNIKLTISSILTDCGNNKAPWSVLQMDRLFNLSDVLSYKDKIPNLDEVFADLNQTLRDTTVMTGEANKGVTDARDAGVQNINYSSYNDQTSRPIVNVSLSGYISNISQAANTSGMPKNVSSRLLATAAQLQNTNDNNVRPSKTKATELESFIGQLQVQAAEIVAGFKAVEDSLNKVERFLENDALYLAAKAVHVHTTRVFDDVDTFLAHVIYQVRTKVGRCEPIYNMYQDLSATVCHGYCGGLNASWIGFGLCAVFTLISIILCVRAAKHFRRVRKADKNRESGNWDDTIEMPWQSGYELNEPNKLLILSRNSYR